MKTLTNERAHELLQTHGLTHLSQASENRMLVLLREVFNLGRNQDTMTIDSDGKPIGRQ